ncbi:MAG: hypothetical protein AB2693_29245 [Candidatus Thiodiazotropha sp.]
MITYQSCFDVVSPKEERNNDEEVSLGEDCQTSGIVIGGVQ